MNHSKTSQSYLSDAPQMPDNLLAEMQQWSNPFNAEREQQVTAMLYQVAGEIRRRAIADGARSEGVVSKVHNMREFSTGVSRRASTIIKGD